MPGPDPLCCLPTLHSGNGGSQHLINRAVNTSTLIEWSNFKKMLLSSMT